ncbi:hypothetical protein [Actinophytocola sp.]|uniref:hypothetical protein n=1 Tax=Actinophytocola sp. TaxID=1872138 RepID=UPI002ED1A696
MAEGSLIRRARRLVAISAFAPPIVFDIYYACWAVVDDRFGSEDLLMVGGVTLLLWLFGLWPFLATRKAPNSWPSVATPGVLMTLMMFSQFAADSRGSAGTASVIATMIVGAAVASLSLNARRMVLDDLSPDVVESDLTITFKPRRGSKAILVVGPEAIAVAEDSQRPDRFHTAASYDEISTVTTWTEVEDTEWKLPGDEEERTVSMPAGELLSIDIPAGQLVVAVHDTAKVKRFVEARLALRQVGVEEQ